MKSYVRVEMGAHPDPLLSLNERTGAASVTVDAHHDEAVTLVSSDALALIQWVDKLAEQRGSLLAFFDRQAGAA